MSTLCCMDAMYHTHDESHDMLQHTLTSCTSAFMQPLTAADKLPCSACASDRHSCRSALASDNLLSACCFLSLTRGNCCLTCCRAEASCEGICFKALHNETASAGPAIKGPVLHAACNACNAQLILPNSIPEWPCVQLAFPIENNTARLASQVSRPGCHITH